MDGINKASGYIFMIAAMTGWFLSLNPKKNKVIFVVMKIMIVVLTTRIRIA